MKTILMGVIIVAQSLVMILHSLHDTREEEKHQQEVAVRDSLINMVYSEDENFMNTYGATDQWRDYMSVRQRDFLGED